MIHMAFTNVELNSRRYSPKSSNFCFTDSGEGCDRVVIDKRLKDHMLNISACVDHMVSITTSHLLPYSGSES